MTPATTLLYGVTIALQIAASGGDSSLTVRVGDRVRTIPVERGPDGRTIALEDLARALEGSVVRTAAGRMRLEVGVGGVEFRTGSTFAIAGADTSVLPFAIARRERDLRIPLTVATDLLPRVSGTNVLYDPERGELRRFAPVRAASRPGRTNVSAGGTTPPTIATATGGTPVATPAARQSTDISQRTVLEAPPPVSTSPVSTTSISTARPGTPGRAGVAKTQRVVVVDAGHGGPDNGMVGPIGGPLRVTEKSVTLAMAHAVRKALEAQGVRVVMTRSTDTLIALSDRGRIANRVRGDVFVSIHVNAANPRWTNASAARGFETYFLAEAKTEDERRVEAMENEAIKFEADLPTSRDDPLGFIMRDMAQNEHLRESLRLASLIQGGMKTVHPGPDRGVKQAGFRVLVTAFMPAVLVEIGFGTNPLESAYLTDPLRQAELADRIAGGVIRYLSEYERKVGAG